MANKGLIRVIILGILIFAGCVLFSFTAIRLKNYRVGDLGLGIATTTKTEYFDSLRLNETEGGYVQILPTIHQFKNDHKKVCLLLGNSQLHSINYQKEGDHLSVYYLNQHASTERLDFRAVQLSSPNINFQEMLLYYLTLRQARIKLSWIVVGCTYRTFQLTSLRQKFKDQLNASSRYIDSLNLIPEVKQFYKDQIELVKVDNAPAEQGNWQEQTEDYITRTLEQNWEAYRYRGNVRSRIKVIPGMIYRSTLSGENFYDGSETTEALNMLFLEQLLELCRKDGVNVFLYQPPHPQSQEPFQYNSARYKACFKKMEHLAEKSDHVYFKTFETLVPLQYWGTSNSGRLDVFHFKTEGHELLGKEIFNFLKETEAKHVVQ